MNNLFILKLQKKFNSFFNNLSYFEDFLIGNKKSRLSKLNSKHIFLSGMPRSGTTIITHILSNFDDVGTYNYSDLPFFKIPFFWSKVKKFYYLNNKNINRPHGDELKINIYSPDAFEELIWRENLENYNSGSFFKYLDSNYDNLKLKQELIRNISKILLLRKKNIYLSKGNYNIFRINFIKKIFDRSFFIICIRNPLDVVNSSIKVHKKFIEMNNKNKNFEKEMSELCHFEFGNSRKNITSENFNNNHDYYLNQWKVIHNLIKSKYLNTENVYLFNFDNFLSNPTESILKLSKKIDLNYNDKINNFINTNVALKNKNKKKLEPVNNDEVNSLYKELLIHCIN